VHDVAPGAERGGRLEVATVAFDRASPPRLAAARRRELAEGAVNGESQAGGSGLRRSQITRLEQAVMSV
jgi:hypothetical protein